MPHPPSSLTVFTHSRFSALILAKLYSNTLISSLNNRAIMKMSRAGPVLDTTTNTYQLSSAAWRKTSGTDVIRSKGTGAGAPSTLYVDVCEETVVAHDHFARVGEDTKTVSFGSDVGRVGADV